MVRMKLICQNIPRQPLEKDSSNIELFYYDKKKIKKGKKDYIRYGIREKQVLNDLLRDNGVCFYFVPIGFHILGVIRRLKLKGHMIKIFNHVNIGTHMKIKLPRFILVYYAGKEKQALSNLFKKFPQIVGKPHYMKTFSVPIVRNLHTLGTIARMKECEYRARRIKKEK